MHRRPRPATPLDALFTDWRWSDAALDCARRQLRRPGSLLIGSEAAGIGKTRLLQALLAGLDEHFMPLYLRGRSETFRFLDRAWTDSRPILVANEISPHLDTYLWGEAARRTLELAGSGWFLWATVHARDEQGVRALFDHARSRSATVIAALCADVLVLTEESGQVHCDAFSIVC